MHERTFEAYGSSCVSSELRRPGDHVGRDHIARLMRQAGIQERSAQEAVAEKHERPGCGQARDLVKRNFAAEAQPAVGG